MPTYISKHRHFIRSNSDLAGPSGRRRRSAAARLLGLWVRIPPEAWMFVCSECCVLSGRGLCDELIIRPEESYRLWCVFVCDLETSWMRRPWPTGGAVAPKTNKINSDLNLNFVFHFHCSMYTCPVYTACSAYSVLQFSLPQKDIGSNICKLPVHASDRWQQITQRYWGYMVFWFVHYIQF